MSVDEEAASKLDIYKSADRVVMKQIYSTTTTTASSCTTGRRLHLLTNLLLAGCIMALPIYYSSSLPLLIVLSASLGAVVLHQSIRSSGPAALNNAGDM